MRNTFATLLLGKLNEIKSAKQSCEMPVLLTGDLGFSVLEPLREAMGSAFLNCGIAEALMTSVAAGIASEGKKVFTYSIIPFATFRCLEQIRNDICYHNKDVTIVGVGAGFGYGSLGATHHATDDLAAMWSLPNLQVFNPACIWQTKEVFELAWNSPGPKYLRLGKGGEGEIRSDLRETIGEGVYRYRNGNSASILCSGNILSEVLAATSGMDIEVICLAKLKPFPQDVGIRRDERPVIVVDELNEYGGFCSMVAMRLSEMGFRTPLKFIHAGDAFAKSVGSAEWQRKSRGLDRDSLRISIQQFIGGLK